MKTVKVPKVPSARCKTEEQCRQISETLKESYKTGRRFKRYGPKIVKEK